MIREVFGLGMDFRGLNVDPAARFGGTQNAKSYRRETRSSTNECTGDWHQTLECESIGGVTHLVLQIYL
jgi:hypothetical protein